MGQDKHKQGLRLEISGKLEQMLIMTPRIRRKISDKELLDRNMPPKIKNEKKSADDSGSI